MHADQVYMNNLNNIYGSNDKTAGDHTSIYKAKIPAQIFFLRSTCVLLDLDKVPTSKRREVRLV